MEQNRQIVLVETPQGALREDHFLLREAPMPSLQPGQILIRTILISLDAANRAWMQGATYREAVRPGDAMHAYVIGQVVASESEGFHPGDIVGSEAVWADYAAVDAKKAQKLPHHRPLTHLLSVLGIAGKTAYHGLLKVGDPKPGETVVVSAAAGSVGILVGQIAKAKGARAVGIAGGADKCQWLTSDLGFDAAVDYKAGNLFKDLKAACPDGIDVYFDNVGGPVLETVLFQMNLRGRIVCCGAVSQYDTATPSGPRNVPGLIVVKRLRMEGFIVMDYAHEDARAEADLKDWMRIGQVKTVEDVVEGLENTPRALIGLLAGENRGKRMVRVAPDPQ